MNEDEGLVLARGARFPRKTNQNAPLKGLNSVERSKRGDEWLKI